MVSFVKANDQQTTEKKSLNKSQVPKAKHLSSKAKGEGFS